MFYHKKCSSPVLLDISDMLFLVVSFGISKSGLRVSNGDIIIRKTKSTPIFTCTNCDEGKISVSDLFTLCMYCGKQLEISETYLPTHSNGTYCEEHVKQFKDAGESIVPLSKVVKEVSIRS